MCTEHVIAKNLNAIFNNTLNVEIKDVVDDCVELVQLILELFHARLGRQVQMKVAYVKGRIRVGHEWDEHVVPVAEDGLQLQKGGLVGAEHLANVLERSGRLRIPVLGGQQLDAPLLPVLPLGLELEEREVAERAEVGHGAQLLVDALEDARVAGGMEGEEVASGVDAPLRNRDQDLS